MKHLGLSVHDARTLMQSKQLPVHIQGGQLYISRQDLLQQPWSLTALHATLLRFWAEDLLAFLAHIGGLYQIGVLPTRLCSVHEYLGIPLNTAAHGIIDALSYDEEDEVQATLEQMRRIVCGFEQCCGPLSVELRPRLLPPQKYSHFVLPRQLHRSVVSKTTAHDLPQHGQV